MEQNAMRDLANRFINAWDSDDEALLRSLYAEDAVLYQAPVKQTLVGVDHLVARWRAFGEIGPGRMSLREAYLDGDTLILETSINAEHTGRFLDIEPTGRTLEIDTCLILKVRDGKIVKHTTYLDTATILRALGLISLEGARPEAA